LTGIPSKTIITMLVSALFDNLAVVFALFKFFHYQRAVQ